MNTQPNLIHHIEKIVEQACAAESNAFGYGIWTHHITQVVKCGHELAPLFGADTEIVEISALLHDYAGIKDYNLYKEHHHHGPIEAETILSQLGYPADRIEAVKHSIAAHRASVPSERRTPEAECLANADAMTHIQHVPSLMHLVFVQYGMGIDEGTSWVRGKLTRSWNKLHPNVQAIVQADYEAALRVLTPL